MRYSGVCWFVFYLLNLLNHSFNNSRLILGSKASSWIWIVPSVFVFMVERLIRFIRGLKKHCIIQQKMHPSQVLELSIENSKSNRIKYRAGQYLYLNINTLSFFEWHPFTITSAPSDSTLTVHIRCEGDWTTELQKEIEKPISKIDSVSIDGPYGTCAEDVFKYSKIILIGAGIGVTPYASILKHIWHISKNSNEIKLKKIHFFWVCPSIDTFEWFGILLQELESGNFIFFLMICILIFSFICVFKKEMRNKHKEDLLEYKLYLTRGWSLKEAKQIAVNIAKRHKVY